MQDSFDPEVETQRRKLDAAHKEFVQLLEEDSVKFVMSTVDGRRFVHRILSFAGVYRSSFTPGDPHSTAFNEGMRNVGLSLYPLLLRYTQQEYNQMIDEAKHDHS